MPAKNVVKTYIAGGIYHIYNRGVNKSPIFHDISDYRVFLMYIKEYLLPKDNTLQLQLSHTKNGREREKISRLLRLKNFHQSLVLLAYCLMPNHFHLLAQQNTADALQQFMQAWMTRYTRYFNEKYKRVGPVFQGAYKALLVESDEQLVHLSRYIHTNPLRIAKSVIDHHNPFLRQPSSYGVYLGLHKQSWVQTGRVLSHFSKHGDNTYKEFVESNEYGTREQTAYILKNATLEEDEA